MLRVVLESLIESGIKTIASLYFCSALCFLSVSTFAAEYDLESVDGIIEKNADYSERRLDTEFEISADAEIESTVDSQFVAEDSTFNDEFEESNETTLTQKLMPKYGNWCGANHPKDMSLADEPIDLLDQACMKHDYCYENEGYLSCSCDNALNQELIAGLLENKFRPAEAVYARSFHLYFNGCPCSGDHSTKVAPSRLVHKLVKKVSKDTVKVVKSLPIIGRKPENNDEE